MRTYENVCVFDFSSRFPRASLSVYAYARAYTIPKEFPSVQWRVYCKLCVIKKRINRFVRARAKKLVEEIKLHCSQSC